jgi:hypothetical protein
MRIGLAAPEFDLRIKKEERYFTGRFTNSRRHIRRE